MTHDYRQSRKGSDVNGFENTDDAILTQALRSLPPRVPPPALSTALRVAASRERQRLLSRRTLGGFFAHCWERTRLSADNFMRPLAVPLAGGVFSAVVVFSLWISTYPVHAENGSDVPILSTAPMVEQASPVGVSGANVVVDVTVDGNGRMVDYTVVSGPSPMDPGFRKRLESSLVLTRFVPGTSFGLPIRANIRLSFNSSSVEVKG